MADVKLSAGAIEVPLELAAAIGEDSLKRPTGSLQVRLDLAEEHGGDGRSGIAQVKDEAVSQAVTCQTLPMPLRRPM